MGTGIDPKVDYAFKRVFGREENRNVLLHLLNALLEDSLPQKIREVELLNPFSDRDAENDKLSVLDIKARDEAGREYLIEMQLFTHASFPERLLYYGAKHYSQQISEGEKYSRLRPVIVICFVNATLFPKMPGYHSRFELIDPKHGGRFTDQFMIHVVELPKFLDTLQPIDDDADRWAYFLRHGGEWDSATMPAFLNAPEFLQATGTLAMLAQSDTERERYEARIKFERDRAAAEDDATERGLAKGMARGLAQGLEEGLSQGLSQGRANEAKTLIRRLGTRRWGVIPANVAESLESITSVEQLEEMADRVIDCRGWNEFIQPGLSPTDSTISG